MGYEVEKKYSSTMLTEAVYVVNKSLSIRSLIQFNFKVSKCKTKSSCLFDLIISCLYAVQSWIINIWLRRFVRCAVIN